MFELNHPKKMAKMAKKIATFGLIVTILFIVNVLSNCRFHKEKIMGEKTLLVKAIDSVPSGAIYKHASVQKWGNTSSEMTWEIDVKKPGKIAVEVIQGDDDGSAGDQYTLSIGNEKLNGVIRKTGAWWHSETVKIGSIQIKKAGRYQITISPTAIVGNDFAAIYGLKLTGDNVEGASVKQKLTSSRGVYFAKKKYSGGKIPTFEQSRAMLPAPILGKDKGYIDMYWRAWEIAFDHMKKPAEGTSFVSNFLDEAFNSQIFQWDTVFMMMFARYAHHIFPSIESLDNFYAQQHPDGFICREINEVTGSDFHAPDSPQAINPPLFSWAEMEYYKITGDLDRLKLVLPVLEKYVQWLETNRKKETKHGLYWSNDMGSGMDHSPRSGSGWVDMSSQMVMQYKHLASMCDALDQKEKAVIYRRRAVEVGKLINKWMWDEKDGLYYDIDDEGNKVRVKTVGSFWPMLAGITNDAQEARMIQSNLHNKDRFWTDMPFPALSKDHPAFNARGDYWRGGVWAPTNTAIISGLYLSGNQEFADLAVDRYLQGLLAVYRRDPDKPETFWEFYAPMKPFGKGEKEGHKTRSDFVGWTGIGPIAMLIENVIGINADAVNNKVTWDLDRTDRHGIERLRFGSTTASFVCEKRNNEKSPGVITVDSDKPFELTVIRANGIKKSFAVAEGKTTFTIN
jgi:hypothetical protein